MKRFLIAWVLWVMIAPATAHAISENDKITRLLHIIETSHVAFIRNNKEYTGPEAKAHLVVKRNGAGNRIKTAEDFITYLASKSSLSGKPYYIKQPDGTVMESGKWLHIKLAEIEADDERGITPPTAGYLSAKGK